MIYELHSWMQSESGLAFKTQLFAIDFTEDALDVATRIVPMAGPSTPNNWNRWVQGIQLFTRGTAPAAAMEQAYIVYNVMRQKGRVALPLLQTGQQYYVLTFNSPGVPEFFDYDKAGRAVFLSTHRLDMQSDITSGKQILA